MQKKIWIGLIAVLIMFSFTALFEVEKAEASEDYAWVLVETRYRNTGATDYADTPIGVWQESNFYTYYLNHSERRIELKSTSQRGRTTNDPPQNMHVIYTWSAPPSVIRANETFSFRVNQELLSNVTGGYGTHMSLNIQAGGGGYWPMLISEPRELTGERSLIFGAPSANVKTFQQSGSAVFTLEDGWAETREGTRRDITVYAGTGGSLGMRELYTYEWKQVSRPAPAPSPGPSPAPGRFSDLDPGHWAHDDIMDMVELGILSGYPDGTFKPNNTISRAEFAKIMVLALELETVRPANPSFTDVGTDHWAYEVVESARDYLTGYRNSRTGEFSFDPGGVAVREDVAVAIVKAQGYGDAPANLSLLNSFPDQGEISPALRNHVAIAVEKGYMRGTDKGFEPQKALTRAEACVLLSRIMVSERAKVITF